LNLQTNYLFPGVGSGFESFPRTFLTLSNLVAGEDWDNLFDDVSVQYPLVINFFICYLNNGLFFFSAHIHAVIALKT